MSDVWFNVNVSLFEKDRVKSAAENSGKQEKSRNVSSSSTSSAGFTLGRPRAPDNGKVPEENGVPGKCTRTLKVTAPHLKTRHCLIFYKKTLSSWPGWCVLPLLENHICLLDCISLDLQEMDIFAAERLPCQQLDCDSNPSDSSDLIFPSYSVRRTGNNLLKDRCRLKLKLERNLDKYVVISNMLFICLGNSLDFCFKGTWVYWTFALRFYSTASVVLFKITLTF